MKSRVFFDSNVYIAGFASGTGASIEIIKLAGRKKFELLICQLVVEESVRNFKKKLPHALSDFEIGLRVLKPALVEQPAKLNLGLMKLFPKKSDQIIFETVKSAKVDHLITLNRKHFHNKKIKDLADFKISTPAEFLKILRDDEEKHS